MLRNSALSQWEHLALIENRVAVQDVKPEFQIDFSTVTQPYLKHATCTY